MRKPTGCMRNIGIAMIVPALLLSGCTVVNARIDVTADGVTISAGVAGASTDITIPNPLKIIIPDAPEATE